MADGLFGSAGGGLAGVACIEFTRQASYGVGISVVIL